MNVHCERGHATYFIYRDCDFALLASRLVLGPFEHFAGALCGANHEIHGPGAH